mgnify:CR=1 FL=1
MRDWDSGTEVSQVQGKFPPQRRRAKTAEGPGLPEPGTMRPTLPRASDGIEPSPSAATPPANNPRERAG